MNLVEKWTAELHTLERLQSITKTESITYRTRQVKIELIKKFINSLNEENE